MKKTLLFALSAIIMTACKPLVAHLAEKCVRDNALVPSSVKVRSHSEVLIPEVTRQDTFYHIASTNGRNDWLDEYEWWDVTEIYSDSIRIETHNFPEHYYCYLQIEVSNQFGVPINTDAEVIVFPNGKAMMYDDYCDVYWEPTTTDTRAQRDTLTSVNDHILIREENHGWGLLQMLRSR